MKEGCTEETRCILFSVQKIIITLVGWGHVPAVREAADGIDEQISTQTVVPV